jgi:hypothetical protein
MSPSLDAPLVSAALRMALGQRRPARSLILHSDRGKPVRQRLLPAAPHPTRSPCFHESPR